MQDLLVREKLLKSWFANSLVANLLIRMLHLSSATSLFGTGQPFEFLLDGDEIHWKWRGLYGALHIQIADLWGKELPDLLPYSRPVHQGINLHPHRANVDR